MLSIDEAIAHAREVAEENRKRIKPKCDYQNLPWIDDENDAYEKYAEEHEQLAEWLEELKAMRNLDKTNFSDGYNAGRTDAEEEAENRLNRVLDDEKRISYEQGIDEAIKKLAESEDTILSDRQYYILMELKEQNNDKSI